MNPYGSSAEYLFAISRGRMLIAIREPSNGGMGIRLKTASTRFIIIACFIRIANGIDKLRLPLRNILSRIAVSMFDKGPARPTQSMSFLGFLRPQ